MTTSKRRVSQSRVMRTSTASFPPVLVKATIASAEILRWTRAVIKWCRMGGPRAAAHATRYGCCEPADRLILQAGPGLMWESYRIFSDVGAEIGLDLGPIKTSPT